MHRRKWLQSGLSVPLAAWLGCSRPTRQVERRRIRVATGPYVAMGGFYLAHERGYFRDAGIDVEPEQIRGSSQAIPLLASKKLDVAFLAVSSPLVNAVARGSELKIVAAREFASPTCGDAGAIYVRKSLLPRGISDLRPLKDKRIAISTKGAIPEFSLDMALEKGGARAGDAQILALPQFDSVAALSAGKIDGLVGHDIEAIMALKRKDLMAVATLGTTLPGFQFAYVVFGAQLLNADIDAGVRFLEAFLRGTREFVAGETPGFLDELASKQGLEASVLRGQCRTTFVTDGNIDLASLQQFSDWVSAKGYCPEKIDARQLVDTRFIDELRKRRKA